MKQICHVLRPAELLLHSVVIVFAVTVNWISAACTLQRQGDIPARSEEHNRFIESWEQPLSHEGHRSLAHAHGYEDSPGTFVWGGRMTLQRFRGKIGLLTHLGGDRCLISPALVSFKTTQSHLRERPVGIAACLQVLPWTRVECSSMIGASLSSSCGVKGACSGASGEAPELSSRNSEASGSGERGSMKALRARCSIICAPRGLPYTASACVDSRLYKGRRRRRRVIR